MSNRVRILSISDDDGLRFSRELLLTNGGYETESITSNEPLPFRRALSFDIALICRSVVPERAMALADRLRRYNPEIQIVSIAPLESQDESCEADLEISPGPGPLLETIRALCAHKEAARRACCEGFHHG